MSQLGKLERFPLWRHRAAIVRGDHKVLVGSGGVPAVYDLRQDVEERKPRPPELDDLLRAAEFGRLPPPPGARQPLAPETVERLRALGYVGP